MSTKSATPEATAPEGATPETPAADSTAAAPEVKAEVLLPLEWTRNEARNHYHAKGQPNDEGHKNVYEIILSPKINLYALKVNGEFLKFEGKYGAETLETHPKKDIEFDASNPKHAALGEGKHEGIQAVYYIKEAKRILQKMEPGKYADLDPELKTRRNPK